jgi:hypothetical protein
MAVGRVALWVVLNCSAALAISAWPAVAQTRGVIELFTSQGCSSCPAADKLMGELAKDPSLVAISVPIDYWDYLGWKDTLATPKHTARQRAYAHTRGDRKVYTPQVVVDGVAHVLGSDRSAIERSLAQSRKGETLSVPIALSIERDQLIIRVEDADERDPAEVWLCRISTAAPVAIGRGENRGRTVTYHNVAREWRKLGTWNGKAQTWSVPLGELKADGTDRAAVLLQAGTAAAPGPMLGAAATNIH